MILTLKHAPTAWERYGEYISHTETELILSIKSKDDGGTSQYTVRVPRTMVEGKDLELIDFRKKEVNEYNENCQTETQEAKL